MNLSLSLIATALVALPLVTPSPPRTKRHLERARAGAGPGSLLAQNLAAHEKRFEIRKEGTARTDG